MFLELESAVDPDCGISAQAAVQNAVHIQRFLPLELIRLWRHGNLPRHSLTASTICGYRRQTGVAVTLLCLDHHLANYARKKELPFQPPLLVVVTDGGSRCRGHWNQAPDRPRSPNLDPTETRVWKWFCRFSKSCCPARNILRFGERSAWRSTSSCSELLWSSGSGQNRPTCDLNFTGGDHDVCSPILSFDAARNRDQWIEASAEYRSP